MQQAVERVTDEILSAFAPGRRHRHRARPRRRAPGVGDQRCLGVQMEDHPQFREWSTGFSAPLDPTCQGDERDAAIRDAGALIGYLDRLIDARRSSPADDLVSILVAAEEAGDRLTGDELVGFIALLLVAGNETTMNLLAGGTKLLLDHPEQRHARS
jgi:cytochrome P450 PksS